MYVKFLFYIHYNNSKKDLKTCIILLKNVILM